jgi:S-formylglutathione hydrolase FrmB
MSLCEIHWFSTTLDKTVAANVIIPDTGTPPFATLYLLHGLSDDHTIWHRRTRVEWYVRELPLMIVMPDGYRGFYTNITNGPRYATYINEELITMVERNFPAKRTRDSRAIGGQSMGGYGALRAAFGYPQLYCSAHSHSGSLLHGSRIWERGSQYDRSEVFGPDPRGSDHDLLKLAADCIKRGAQFPQLLIDCATEDFLIEHNREFHTKLEALRVPHTYREFPGDHNWDYWDQHIRDAIDFHARAMNVTQIT